MRLPDGHARIMLHAMRHAPLKPKAVRVDDRRAQLGADGYRDE